MKIIDAHIHTNFNKKELKELARKNNINFSIKGLAGEMAKNSVVNAISITDHFEQETPIAFEEIKKQCSEFSLIVSCVGINPLKITKNSVRIIEQGIIKKEIKALKIYLGYYPFYANDRVYSVFYRLAGKYGIPVIFHTGDTLLRDAKLKYSLPLSIDEVAVDFPKTKFIIAHLGNPWIEDAAEVIYKNPNVYGDLSGLFAADNSLEKELARRIRNAFLYIENPSKLMYGSDWPIVSMGRYIKFIKRCIPVKYHNQVFYLNAKNVFKI